MLTSFNTASGRYCCNSPPFGVTKKVFLFVSIPQAVGTVATFVVVPLGIDISLVSIPQAVGTVATVTVRWQ